MGTEPKEEDIPTTVEDLSDFTRDILEIYGILSDNYTDSGYYLGKSIAGVNELFDIFEISDNEKKILALRMIKIIDKFVSKQVSDRIKREMKAAEGRKR